MRTAMIVKLLLLSIALTVSCNDQVNKEQDNQICPLRVSVSQQIPFHILTKLPNGTYDYKGSMSDILKLIAEQIKRPLVPVVPSDKDLKEYGYNQASYKQVVDGVADISGMAISVEADQLQQIDFSYPCALASYKMIVPAGHEASRLFAFTRPFQPLVWMFLAISLIGFVISASTIRLLHDRADLRITNQQVPSRFARHLLTFSIYSLSIISGHGYRNPFISRNAMRIFGAFWLLMMTVLVYAYSGLLISCLTVPTMTKPIETLQDVADSKDITLQINPDGLSGLGKTVMEGKSGVWKALGDQLRRRPEGLYYKTLTNDNFNTTRQNFATPQIDLYSAWMIRRLYKKEKTCRFHLTRPIPYIGRTYFVIRKGYTDKKRISQTIMKLHEFGFIQHYIRKDFFVAGGSDKCLKQEKNSANNVPIKFVDLTSAFLILGVGLGLAILCFLLELIVANYRDTQNINSL